MKMKKITVMVPMAIGIGVASLLGTAFTPPPATEATEILGAGATFPYPLYSKMFDEYNKATGVKVNYQSIGSGGGIKQLMAKTVDFGASDAPMSDEELKNSPAAIVHIPVALGADVVTYNIPGEPTLMFT